MLQEVFFTYFLAFIVAAFIAFLQLETTTYPHTNFLIRLKLITVVYSLFYGALGVIFYGIVVYTGIDMLIGDKIVKEPYLQAVLVGIFSKGISDWNFYTLPIGDNAKPLGIKTITEPIESTLLKKIDEEEYNSLKEYVTPVRDCYCKTQNDGAERPEEKVLKRICDSLPANSKAKKLAYKEDLKNVMADYDSDGAKVSAALEKYLRDFGKRSYERVFKIDV
ncbi:MAG: hypothetical protein NTY37_09630 [Methanothrix sp.]|nr:hypothetical protein [Methanothrix sp.]